MKHAPFDHGCSPYWCRSSTTFFLTVIILFFPFFSNLSWLLNNYIDKIFVLHHVTSCPFFKYVFCPLAGILVFN